MSIQCVYCSASNPDGKRFCGDCGALLDTSLGGVKQYLDANLRQEIQAVLKEEYREQKFVESAISQAILEKLTSWIKIFASLVGIPIGLAVIVLGMLGFKSYTDFSKLITEANNHVSVTLQEIEKKVDGFKREGDQLQAEYIRLESQLGDTTALAAQVNQLSGKVSDIEQQIKITPSSAMTPEISKRLESSLRSFQAYLSQIGFRIMTTKPLNIETKPALTGGAVSIYDENTNTVQVRETDASDLTLVLYSYTGSVLRSQDAYVPRRYEDVQHNAVIRGMQAYLSCGFLNASPCASQRNSSSNTRRPQEIKWAEDGHEVWGGLFWDMRDLLQQSAADKLIVSAWLSAQKSQSDSDFPRLFATTLLETYQRTMDNGKTEQLRTLFRSRGIELRTQ